MPAPRRQQLCAGGHHQPLGEGKESLKPHTGVSGCDKGGLSQTHPALGLCAEACGEGRWVLSVPPRARAGCFTFFLPNKSAEKSLLETILLDLLASSLPQPTASSLPHRKGHSILRGLGSTSRPVGGQSGGLCHVLQSCSGWRTERVTGAGSAVSVIPWDGKLSLNQRGHLAL